MLPLLSPLVVALLLAALNPRPTLSLRLLIWRSPDLPIGLWLGAGAGGGALLSASATALALRQGRANPRRRGRGERQDGAAAASSEPWSQAWEEPAARPDRASWFNRPAADRSTVAAETPPPTAARRSNAGSAGPERAPGEPAPTVSVPFRVLHRPSGGPVETQPGRQSRAEAPPPFVAQAERELVTVEDDWAQNEGDDW